MHGLFSSSSIFRHFVDLIDKNVILVELRGIVYSAIKKPFVQNYVKDIHSILEEEKITGNVILVGYSLGCAIANRFAEDFSHMVKKVIMLSPINRGIHEIGLKKMIETLIESLGKDFFRKWKEYLRLENQWPVHKIFSLFNFRLLRESFQGIRFTAKSPIVIVNGFKDTFFDVGDERLKLPNVIRHTIEDLDHFLFLTKEGIQKVAVRLKDLI